MRLVKTEREY